MPQVDLETLVSACAGGGSDRKITCETLADDECFPEKEYVPDADVPPDFPPESFWLSKDAELDWFDRNAFLERKDSTKGISTSSNFNLNPYPNPNINSSSQRFSVKKRSKASLFRLPKTQKANYIDTTKRRNNKPANVQLFPKRSSSVGKTPVAVAEPSSPKVSCMGRVRSKRGRRRSCDVSNYKRENSVQKKSKSVGEKRKKKGFCSRVFSAFKCGGDDRKPVVSEMEKMAAEEEEAPRKSVTVRMREIPGSVEPVAEPPGLGGLKKFASGRRSGSWSTDDFDVAFSNSMGIDGPTR